MAMATATTPSAVEPAVLGSVRAIADFLEMVVKSGVEEAYQRANPLLFATPVALDYATSSPSPSQSTGIAGTVPQSADDVTANVSTCALGYREGKPAAVVNIEQPTYTVPLHSIDNDNDPMKMLTTSRTPAPMLHEVQFNPSMASSSSQSKKCSSSTSKRDSSDGPDSRHQKVFDPNAAGSSSSSLLSSSEYPPSLINASLNHSRATKKAYRGGEVHEKTPARALGDLGRTGHGLFLVLHCDDIHFDPSPSFSHHSEVIAALKELYSSPVGNGIGSRGGENASGISSLTGPAFHYFPLHPIVLPFNDHFIAHNDQPPRLVSAPPSRNSLIRVLHDEAIFERIVRIVKKQGDLIVWGTQEILAEIGE